MAEVVEQFHRLVAGDHRPATQHAAGRTRRLLALADQFVDRRDDADHDLGTLGSEDAGHLWREYADAMKGTQQLVWSQGLKELLGVHVDDDSDIATEDNTTQEYTLLATLDLRTWKVIRDKNLRGLLLAAAARGRAELDSFLQQHTTCPTDSPTGQGE